MGKSYVSDSAFADAMRDTMLSICSSPLMGSPAYMQIMDPTSSGFRARKTLFSMQCMYLMASTLTLQGVKIFSSLTAFYIYGVHFPILCEAISSIII